MTKYIHDWLILPVFHFLDKLVPKYKTHWAFCTHHLHAGKFIESQRAIFEHIKHDPSIVKVIFYRGKLEDPLLENHVNTILVRHGSFQGFKLLIRCKVVFITHSVSMEYSLRWTQKIFSVVKLSLKNRYVIHISHGISVKKLLTTSNKSVREHTDRVKFRRYERAHYTGMLASSDIDAYAMASMFYPISFDKIWITGIPRNDFLKDSIEKLPAYIRRSVESIQFVKRGRKMVLYAPTYRQTGASEGAYYYQFSELEIDQLKEVLRANNAFLAFRPHYFKNASTTFNLDKFIDNDLIIDASQSIIPEIAAALRECDLVVTDYSSVYVDAIFLRKPVIGFAYDLEHYQTQQDGLLYDTDITFAGPMLQKFSDVISIIGETLRNKNEVDQKSIQFKIFYKFDDGNNSNRVIERVKSLPE